MANSSREKSVWDHSGFTPESERRPRALAVPSDAKRVLDKEPSDAEIRAQALAAEVERLTKENENLRLEKSRVETSHADRSRVERSRIEGGHADRSHVENSRTNWSLLGTRVESSAPSRAQNLTRHSVVVARDTKQERSRTKIEIETEKNTPEDDYRALSFYWSSGRLLLLALFPFVLKRTSAEGLTRIAAYLSKREPHIAAAFVDAQHKSWPDLDGEVYAPVKKNLIKWINALIKEDSRETPNSIFNIIDGSGSDKVAQGAGVPKEITAFYGNLLVILKQSNLDWPKQIDPKLNSQLKDLDRLKRKNTMIMNRVNLTKPASFLPKSEKEFADLHKYFDDFCKSIRRQQSRSVAPASKAS